MQLGQVAGGWQAIRLQLGPVSPQAMRAHSGGPHADHSLESRPLEGSMVLWRPLPMLTPPADHCGLNTVILLPPEALMALC